MSMEPDDPIIINQLGDPIALPVWYDRLREIGERDSTLF